MLDRRVTGSRAGLSLQTFLPLWLSLLLPLAILLGGCAGFATGESEPVAIGVSAVQAASEPGASGSASEKTASEKTLSEPVASEQEVYETTTADPAVRRLDSSLSGDYRILHFSDLHGTVEDGAERPVLSVLADHLRHEEASDPTHTLTLSAGDNVDGSLKVFASSHESPVLQAFGLFGVDATALGNHEYRVYGREGTLDRMMAGSTFPILCANLLDPTTGESRFTPYRIYTLDTLRVAVIGSSSNKIRDRYLNGSKAPLLYVDHAEAINPIAQDLRARNEADVVVALVHEGGYEDAKGRGGGTIVKLAQALEDVDAVFGGDSHSLVDVRVDGMPVLVPGAYGEGYMTLEIHVDPEGELSYQTAWTNLDTAENGGYRSATPHRDDEVDALLAAAGFVFAQ